ncbi:MAG: transposase [Mycobacteriaceae bacterium]
MQGRTSTAVLPSLDQQPAPWRAAITHVSIDLSAPYAKAVREALPDAILVADRFHLVHLAHDMLSQVRNFYEYVVGTPMTLIVQWDESLHQTRCDSHRPSQYIA